MEDEDLLYDVCELANLLKTMQEKITTMTTLPNSIQKEEALPPREITETKRFMGLSPSQARIFIPVYAAVTAVYTLIRTLFHLLFNSFTTKTLIATLSVTLRTNMIFHLLITFYITVVLIKRFVPRGAEKTDEDILRETREEEAWLAKTHEIEDRNEKIRFQNRAILAQCSALNKEVQELQDQITELVEDIGYPPDYVTIDATYFFINALRNDRADDFRRLIDLYEEQGFRKQVLAGQRELTNLMTQQVYNQQEMTRLLCYSNGLSAANLAAQIKTQAEIRAVGESVESLGGRPRNR